MPQQIFEVNVGGTIYEVQAPSMEAAVAAVKQQATAASPMRTLSEEHPYQYLGETAANILPSAWNNVKGLAGLASTAAGATGEVGSAIGSRLRELVGLDPHYTQGTPNLEALGQVPGLIVQRAKDYMDDEGRARIVHDDPVGMGLDMYGVIEGAGAGGRLGAQGARAAAPAARAVADATGSGLKTAMAHPLGKAAAGTALGYALGGKYGALAGALGGGKAGDLLDALYKRGEAPPGAPPAPGPEVPPGAPPGAPGAAPGGAAPVDPAAERAAWEADQRARQSVKDQLYRDSQMNRAKAKADAAAAYPTKPTQPAPAPIPTTPVPQPGAQAPVTPQPASPPAAAAPPGGADAAIAGEAAARMGGPGVGPLTGDDALHQAALQQFAEQLRSGQVNPMANLDISPIGGNRPGRILPGVTQPELLRMRDALQTKWRKGGLTVAEDAQLKEVLARLSQDERARTGTRGARR